MRGGDACGTTVPRQQSVEKPSHEEFDRLDFDHIHPGPIAPMGTRLTRGSVPGDRSPLTPGDTLPPLRGSSAVNLTSCPRGLCAKNHAHVFLATPAFVFPCPPLFLRSRSKVALNGFRC